MWPVSEPMGVVCHKLWLEAVGPFLPSGPGGWGVWGCRLEAEGQPSAAMLYSMIFLLGGTHRTQKLPRWE